VKKEVEIMFITPWYPLPRIIKRIEIAKNVAKTGIIYWNKNDNNHYPNDIDAKVNIYRIKCKSKEGLSLKRFFTTLCFYKKAFGILNKHPIKCIHTTKVDLLFMVYLYRIFYMKKKIKVIYEISDLHDSAYNDCRKLNKVFVRKLIYVFEKVAGRCVDSIILTSPGFWDEYYKKIYKDKNYLFVPNASDLSVFKAYRRKENGIFTVGYMGNLCHYDQLEILINLTNEMDIGVFIAGGGFNEERLKKLKQNDRVYFYGKYRFNEDIANLYSKVDCIYALYDSESKNTKIALPNRLYDAASCGLPIIASKNTILGQIVDEYKLGVTVERNNIEDIKKGIYELRSMQKGKFKNNAQIFIRSLNLDEINKKIEKIYIEACINE